MAIELVQEIGRRTTVITQDTRETSLSVDEIPSERRRVSM